MANKLKAQIKIRLASEPTEYEMEILEYNDLKAPCIELQLLSGLKIPIDNILTIKAGMDTSILFATALKGFEIHFKDIWCP